jgi:hypothetical protein
MISKEFAKSQMERLSALKRFPFNAEAKRDLVKALMGAISEAHLALYIDNLVNYETECPPLSTIRTGLAEQGRQTQEALKACEVCGGSGFVVVRGRSTHDGLEVTAAKLCACRSFGQPIKREHDCPRCQGFGFYGGEIAGQYAGPWKWCDCVYGREKREREPELVAEANTAREKLIRRAISKPQDFKFKSLPQEESYYGEY